MSTYLISLSLLICAVIAIRAIFRKRTSQRLIYAMWILVLIRMCIPFSLFEVEMPHHIYEAIKQPADTDIVLDITEHETSVVSPESTPTLENDTEINGGGIINNDGSSTEENISGTVTPPANDIPTVSTPEPKKKIDLPKLLYTVWVAGSAAMAIWFFISWLIFTFKLWNTDTYHSEYNDIKVYVSDKIASPCVAGIKPVIYITKEASESENLAYVLAHEYTHLRHGDRVWSAIRVLATCVFWWNPLVWAAAFLSKSDAELACDESVARKFSETERHSYANSIVDMIPKKSNYAIGFGNGSIKERIVMLTTNKPKKIFISVIAVIVAVACVGCAYIDPTLSPNDQDDANDKESTDITTSCDDTTIIETEPVNTPPDENDSEGEIVEITQQFKTLARNYYAYIFAKRFQQGETVNPDDFMEYFIFDEFYVSDDNSVKEDYVKYNPSKTNNASDMHSIPVEVVNKWLTEHFDIAIDPTLSTRYYNGNGNYNIKLYGRGGQWAHVSRVVSKGNGVFIIDAIGALDYSDICYNYFRLAVELKDDDFKFLYCKSYTPDTEYTAEDAVDILADAMGYTKDEASYAVIFETVTIPSLGDDTFCNISPYVALGIPGHLAEGEYFRAKLSYSCDLYVSLNSGKVYEAIFSDSFGHTVEKLDLYVSPIANESCIDAFEALEFAKNVYKDNRKDSVYDCYLQPCEINGKYYYKVKTYNFFEYDKEKYSEGYVPTKNDYLYVDITDGKVYEKQLGDDYISYSMVLYE